jgi:Zn-dependent protease
MAWSFRIFRIAGTDVKVHVTFFLVLVYYATEAYRAGGGAAVPETLAVVLAIFACVLLHEFGHITMARRFGVRTPDVILLPIGGVARLERMPDEPIQEFLIAIAGPIVTLLIAVVCYLFLRLAGQHPTILNLDVEHLSPIAVLMRVNAVLLVFNLIPAFPMDGGRVLRSLLAMRVGLVRATRTAASIGQVLALAGGMYGLYSNQFVLVLIAFFVFIGAGAEVTAVQTRTAGMGIRVADMMMTQFRTIPLHARLEQAAQMLLEGDQREFPAVDNNGRIEGILSRDNLIKGLSERGPQSTVEEAMTSNVPLLDPGQGFDQALAQLKQSGTSALPVVDRSGGLVGLLSLDNISELILVRNALLKDHGGRTR